MRAVLFAAGIAAAFTTLGCHGDEVAAAPTDSGFGETPVVDSSSSDLDTSSSAEVARDTTTPGDTAGDTTAPPVETGTCVDTGRGPTSISIGTYCIDATEVTNAQYNAFLDAAVAPQSVSKTPAVCTFNTTYGSKVNEPSTLDWPRSNVDWCDATAFCAWAGKHLCGTIGTGAPVAVSDYASMDKDEWYRACTGADPKNVYPYGDTFDLTRCHVDFGTEGPVGSATGCHGTRAPFDMIFDMAGNRWEWENACDSEDVTANCLMRGGGTPYNDPAYSRCDEMYDDKSREYFDIGLGFRCCQ